MTAYIKNVSLDFFLNSPTLNSINVDAVISLCDIDVTEEVLDKITSRREALGVSIDNHIVLKVKDDNSDFGESHARCIFDALDSHLWNNRSVIVHCVAGLSRSGAVADFAEVLGFERLRSVTGLGNSHIKSMLMRVYRNNYDYND